MCVHPFDRTGGQPRVNTITQQLDSNWFNGVESIILDFQPLRARTPIQGQTEDTATVWFQFSHSPTPPFARVAARGDPFF